MPRSCSVCAHADLDAIQAALAERRPYRQIAGQYGLSESALSRHREHTAQAIDAAQDAATLTHGERLLAELARLQASAGAMLTRGEASADERTVAAALRESRACLELGAKLSGVLTPGGVAVDVQVNEPAAPRADLSVLTDDELESLIAIQQKLEVAASELVDVVDPEKYICVRLQKRREGPAHHFVYPGRHPTERLVYPAPADPEHDEPEPADEPEPPEMPAPIPLSVRTSARLGVPGSAPPVPAPRPLPPADARLPARSRQG